MIDPDDLSTDTGTVLAYFARLVPLILILVLLGWCLSTAPSRSQWEDEDWCLDAKFDNWVPCPKAGQ